jgi:histidine triad (HIT) family protein
VNHCIFCEIVRDPKKARVIFADDDYMAFEDAHPQAPSHFLVIPKKHIDTLLEADKSTLGDLMSIAVEEARKKGLDAAGFRTVVNCKRHAGQSVYHLHVHVLGGRWFTWPPG